MSRRLVKIVLQYIKSHLYTVVELDKGFNVIGGESDQGKSIIMTTIRWVMKNEPIGWDPTPWESTGAQKGKESRAEFHYDDGTIVARARSKTENYYQINNGKKLGSLKPGRVPDEVAAVLNIGDDNIQTQAETFFLLQQTSGQVAKKINEVVNLKSMDAALVEALRREKETKVDIKINKKSLEAKRESFTKLDMVEAADEKLRLIEAAEEELNKDKEKLSAVSEAADAAAEAEAVIVRLGPVDIMAAKVESFSITGKDLAAASRDLDELVKHIDNYVEAKDTLQSLEQVTGADTKLSEISLKFSELVKDSIALVKVSEAVDAAQDLQQTVTDLQQIDACALVMEGIQEKFSEVARAERKLQASAEVIAGVVEAKENIEKFSLLQNCDLDITDIYTRFMQVVEEIQTMGSVESVLESIKLINRELQVLDIEHKNASEKLAELRSQIEECPTCGSVTHLQHPTGT